MNKTCTSPCYRHDTHFFSTFGDLDPNHLPKATRKTNILSYNLLLFPMHILKVHWALVYADTNTHMVYYMGSMFNPVNASNALKLVQGYLYLETVRLRGEEDARPFMLRFVPDAPQQAMAMTAVYLSVSTRSPSAAGCTKASLRLTYRLSAATLSGRS